MCSKIIKVVFSKKIIIVMFMALLVTSCTTDGYQSRELPLLKHDYSKKKLTVYNIFGFSYDKASRGIFNVIDEIPTEFLINIYISYKYIYW